MKTRQLADILVKTGVVQSGAVDDPEGYDNCETMGRISEAAALIAAVESDAEVINAEMVRGDAMLLDLIAERRGLRLPTIAEGITEVANQRDAWRACADRAISELLAFSKYPNELLAEYERLKGQP